MNEKINQRLRQSSDKKYKTFIEKLTFTKYEIMGVRMPILKDLVKEYKYLDSYLPYEDTYEEILFEGLFISSKYKVLEEKLNMLDNYIEKIDNWGICDSVISSVKYRDNEKKVLDDFVCNNLASNSEYRLRFIILLMKKLVKDNSYHKVIIDNLKLINDKHLDYYYVDMAIAWLLQELYIYNDEIVMKFLEACDNKFIKQKTISKILDSRTTSDERRIALKDWRMVNV